MLTRTPSPRRLPPVQLFRQYLRLKLPCLQQPPRFRGETDYGRLPLYFIENRGQVDKRVKYYVRDSGQTAFFTQDEIVLSLAKPGTKRADRQSAFIRGDQPSHRDLPRKPETGNHRSVVRIKPVGLKKGVTIAALNQTDHRVNYFVGKDPNKWSIDIPTYQAVIYEQAYTGIDLKFYGQGRQLEYDIIVQPGADPDQVKLAYQGVKKLEVTREGDLALILPDGGRLLQKKPLVYQEIAGQRVPVAGKFRLCRQGAQVTCGFALAAYDKTRPLVIDPVLIYSTYLGGSATDSLYSLAVDTAGAAYVAGQTNSDNFPVQNAIQNTIKGNYDAFVSKLSPAGNSLVYSTYLGGDGDDYASGLTVDADGNVYFSGSTASDNFPTTTGAYQSTIKGDYDAFVTKLSSAGNALLYSTYMGGSLQDVANAVAVDSTGAAYVAGFTYSDDFPTTPGAFQETWAGNRDAFVTKLSSTGNALLYSTYLGGGQADVANALAVDSAGDAFVTGFTLSDNFPITVGAFQETWSGDYDAFVTKLNPTGSAPVYSTFLGGSQLDGANSIAVDRFGNSYIAGLTNSDNFPTTVGAFQETRAGNSDAFVTKLNPAGNALVYSTFLGDVNADVANAVVVDRLFNAYVAGYTWSHNFPTSKAVQTTKSGMSDAFVTKLNPAGNALVYSTYLGGTLEDVGNAIAVDRFHTAYVAGYTTSDNFPTRNAFQETFSGVRDGFVSKLSRGQSLVPYYLLLD